MDVRLAAEALARLNLSAPAKRRAASRVACQCRQLHLPTTPYRQRTSTPRWAQRRDISASSIRRAPPAGAAAAQQSAPDHLAQPHQQSPRSSQPVQRGPRDRQMPSDDEIATIVDQSFQPGQNAAPRTSRHKSAHAQQVNRDPSTTQRPWQSSRFASENANKRSFVQPRQEGARREGSRISTADMVSAAMRRDPLVSGSTRPNESTVGLLDQFKTTNDVEPTKKNDDPFDLDSLVDDAISPTRKAAYTPQPIPKSSLRLGSSVGRTIEIDEMRGRDLIRAIGQLDMRLSSNGIRNMYHKQKFHERPGLKRKRLARERWRKKFKAGFEHVTKRVKYLTKMGW